MDDDNRSSIEADVTTRALAWQALRRAHARVAARLESALLDRFGLSVNEFDVLFELQHRLEQDRTARIHELLEVVPLSQPALSRLLARLEARGLLARCPASEDRRGILVRITDHGMNIIDDATRLYVQTVDDCLTSRLSDDEQVALLTLLRRVGE
ncbi:MAG TPA: MarR family transcriptional regulator [Thermomicrobiaceae bacterium]|nr:MarR family transcriptional regulator [Thermomicrobiaceae bacterium]